MTETELADGPSCLPKPRQFVRKPRETEDEPKADIWLYSRPTARLAGTFAMQKVEGSNPFSRSKEKPRSGGAFCVRSAGTSRCRLLGYGPAAHCWPISDPRNTAFSANRYMVGKQGHRHRDSGGV